MGTKKHATVTSLTELYGLLSRINYSHSSHIYRGLPCSSYDLLSSIAHTTSSSAVLQSSRNEEKMLEDFKRNSIGYTNNNNLKNDIEWLILAQHCGMPTRLIDFSFNPLVATYFACRSNADDDGVVCILCGLVDRSGKISSPWNVKRPTKFRPRVLADRILTQSAVMVIPSDVQRPLEEFFRIGDLPSSYSRTAGKVLYKLGIPASKKLHLLNELEKSGITEETLFPGLDGVAKRIMMTNYFTKMKSTTAKSAQKQVRAK